MTTIGETRGKVSTYKHFKDWNAGSLYSKPAQVLRRIIF